MRFHTLGAFKDAKIAKVIAGCVATHYAAIDSAGQLFVWGRNERGQCGTGHLGNVYAPSPAAGIPGPVVAAAVGRSHTLAVNAAGEVYAVGEGKAGQLGLGRTVDTQLTWAKANKGLPAGDPVIAVSAGNDFSMALTAGGKLFACGSSENGQLGNGTNGERIASAGKTAFDAEPTWIPVKGLDAKTEGERIVAVSCGANHTLALTAEGRAWSWGAGGYGRLGHSSPKDETAPRRLQAFEPERMRVKTIAAGTTVSYFVTRMGDMLYAAGQTKKSGEANMYPKPLHDLAG